MAAKTLKKSVSLTDNEVQAFLEGKENQYTKEKPKGTNSVALVSAFLSAENEIDNWKICRSPILAVYLKDILCR